MRIAMVSEHASPLAALGGADAGGQNVHVAALATALAARGHHVTVYTRRADQELSRVVAVSAGVRVVHLDAGPPAPVPKDELLPYIPALSRSLSAALDDDPPDVVHAHFWMSGLAALAALTGRDVPLVQTFHALGSVKRRHQGAADTSPPSRIWMERDVAHRAARVIAACADEVRELRAMGVPHAAIDVVPSGVDLDLFRGRPDRPPPPRRLLSVGRMVARKGVDDAIRMLSRLPGTELVIAGGPPADRLPHDAEYRRLRGIADERKLLDRVRFIGTVPHEDLPSLMASVRAVVCLPWYEPFGIVPLEAMACGTPVIGTAVGGMLDTVIDGKTGYLLPPRDPIAAARAALRVIEDDQRWRRMSTAGISHAARYTWTRAAAQTERSYLRALVDTARRVSVDAKPAVGR
jgi:D-inositol-3-phosphate glycosyltransferase